MNSVLSVNVGIDGTYLSILNINSLYSSNCIKKLV